MTRLMYDSVNPGAIPTDASMVAGYIDGTAYRWPESSWDRFPHAVKVRIARRVTTNDGHVLDVEAGIPTVWPPSLRIVDWVQMRRDSGVEPTIYCNQVNDWPTIRQIFTSAGVPQPQYWVARYNNIPAIPSGAVAKQYANPPLAGGHYDLSIVADYWPGVDPVPNKENEMELSDKLVLAPEPYTSPSERQEFTVADAFFGIHYHAKRADQRMEALTSEVAALRATLEALIGDGTRVVARGEIVLSVE